MGNARRSSRRANSSGGAGPSDEAVGGVNVYCFHCNGITAMDDLDWICLCTSEAGAQEMRDALGGRRAGAEAVPTVRDVQHGG